MEPLTENIIKKVALRFFRHYYKYRLRYEDQPVTAKYDLEGVGGIVADGYYSFKKVDGKPFVATFEATSIGTREEVIYKPQQKVLFWDGFAVATVLTLLFAGLNYFYGFHELTGTRLAARIGLTLFSLLVCLVAFYLIAKNFSRYRYIYAIEQFKKYYADEQWVALASDVFPNSNDKYLRELKNQCVNNGFGLLMIDDKLDSKILITPSRQDIFMGKRRMVEFFSKNRLPAQIKNSKLAGEFGFWRSQLPELFHKDHSLLRYKRSFFNQIAVAALCLVLMGMIFSKELQKADLQVVDNQEYREDIATSKSNNQPEQPEYLTDSTLPSNKKKQQLNEGYWDTSSPPKVEQDTASTEEASPLAENKASEEFTSKGGEQEIAYDCTRYYNFDSPKYIIEEGVYPTWQSTLDRLTGLRKNKLECASLLLACFSKNEKGYVVYLGMIYNSREEAMDEWSRLDKEQPKAVPNSKLKLRRLDPILEVSAQQGGNK
ncbi:MAG: hypothetical protein R2830_06660 [Saprospiraceae bacterium]